MKVTSADIEVSGRPAMTQALLQALRHENGTALQLLRGRPGEWWVECQRVRPRGCWLLATLYVEREVEARAALHDLLREALSKAAPTTVHIGTTYEH